MVSVGGGGLVGLMGAAIAGIVMLLCYFQSPGDQDPSSRRRKGLFGRFRKEKWLPIPQKESAAIYDRIPDNSTTTVTDNCIIHIQSSGTKWITDGSTTEPVPESVWEDAYTSLSRKAAATAAAAAAKEEETKSSSTLIDVLDCPKSHVAKEPQPVTDPVIDLDECPIVVSLSYAHFDEAFFKILEDMVLEQEAFERHNNTCKHTKQRRKSSRAELSRRSEPPVEIVESEEPDGSYTISAVHLSAPTKHKRKRRHSHASSSSYSYDPVER